MLSVASLVFAVDSTKRVCQQQWSSPGYL